MFLLKLHENKWRQKKRLASTLGEAFFLTIGYRADFSLV